MYHTADSTIPVRPVVSYKYWNCMDKTPFLVRQDSRFFLSIYYHTSVGYVKQFSPIFHNYACVLPADKVLLNIVKKRCTEGVEMNELNNSFLLFKSDGLFFLLPLNAVERVMDADKPEELAAVECRVLLGKSDSLKAYRYRLMLHMDLDDKCLLLPAQEVVGLVDIGEEQRFSLPGQLRSNQNRYLEALAEVETQEGKRVPAYILNPACLSAEAWG